MYYLLSTDWTVESDWDLTPEQWILMSKCNKCGNQLYPYSSQSAEAWAVSAYMKCQHKGVSPETLRDQQSPGLINAIKRRKPKLLNYRTL